MFLHQLIRSFSQRRLFWLGHLIVFSVAVAARVAFWLYTDWAIEDGMIIARMVKNLVDSGQFSYNVGARISSSTSPLFGLLSALIAWTGIPPLSSAKILGVIASSITAVFIFRILFKYRIDSDLDKLQEQNRVLGAVAGSMIYVLLPPIIAYSVSGLETPVYALLCAMTLDRLAERKDPKAKKIAMWLATLTALFRPDGAILLAVVAMVIIWEGRENFSKAVLQLWPALVVIPIGVLAHQLYFGAPVPQSLLAKVSGYSIDIPRNAQRYLNQMLFAQPGSVLFYLLGLFGAWWVSRKAPQLLIFLFWYVIYHLIFILRAPLFDWYLQVPLFILCIFSAFGIHAVGKIFQNINLGNWKAFVEPIMGIGISVVLIAAMIFYARGKRMGQFYEMSVRGAAGSWLTENTSRDALVFTESLGFIGYYAHNSFVDWPGLASPNVPDLLRENDVQSSRIDSYDTIILYYKPEYLVLRDNEWETLEVSIKNKYRVCKLLNSPAGYNGIGYLIAGKFCP